MEKIEEQVQFSWEEMYKLQQRIFFSEDDLFLLQSADGNH
jgi:hypothetical protein